MLNCTRFLFLLLICICVMPQLAMSKPLADKDIPDPLKPWKAWVLKGQEHKRCPFLFSDGDSFRCVWPGELNIDIKQRSARFEQSWLIENETWVALPGDEKNWPLEVKANGKSVKVAAQGGRPQVYLKKGSHNLTGVINWKVLPEYLQIPRQSGIVRFKLNGKNISFPEIGDQGQLWIQSRQATRKVADRVELQVFRHIEDSIPLKVTVYISLDVSGQARELKLPDPFGEQFIPYQLNSSLPAKLEADGSLLLQVRPGHWVVSLTARQTTQTNALTFTPIKSNWVDEEVWVFKAMPDLRIVEVTGVSAIDPQQTNLPKVWKRLPAYRLLPNQTMTFVEKRRGDSQPAPDELQLRRNIWLSFNGDRYTLQDQILGKKNTGWRLEMNAPVKLGQVKVNGVQQSITRKPDSSRVGVELRQGQINLTANSEMYDPLRTLSAVGWDQDFNQLSTTLHLPPGWRIFSASGVDQVNTTWINQWTLLDFFIVLIITLSIGKLWSKPLAALALVTLVLIYHEPGAPRWVWLHLVAAVAFLKVLPAGKFKTAVTYFRSLVLISLFVITVPYIVKEVRKGLHPQLEYPHKSTRLDQVAETRSTTFYANAPGQISEDPGMLRTESPALEEVIVRDQAEMEHSYSRRKVDKVASSINAFSGISTRDLRNIAQKKAKFMQYDPDATIQTGPGIPEWQWNRVNMSWSGPVSRDQQISLTLIGPKTNFVLAGLRVVLLCLLILGILNIRYGPKTGWRLPQVGISSPGTSSPGTSSLSVMIFAMSLMFVFHSREVQADIPDQKILNELRDRLLEKADCLPRCAEIQSMSVSADSKALNLNLKVHSFELVAIPLPGQASEWLPRRVLVNQMPATGLLRDQNGTLWLRLNKGQYQISMAGPLPQKANINLALPMKPHSVSVSAKDWVVNGVHADGDVDNQLQLTRIKIKDSAMDSVSFDASQLPPFVEVERKILLGLKWQVETKVKRLTPGGSPVVLAVPLLKGESVTTDGVRVKESKVLVSLGPNVNEVRWSAVLNSGDDVTNDSTERTAYPRVIELQAAQTSQWVENWKVDAATIWHVEADGIPVIYHQQGNRWLPEWRPWPGETVSLTITRPEGVEGETKTVDQARLLLKPGLRITSANLTFQLRSSQGGQHPITLPLGSTLNSVKIDNQVQPVRMEDQTILLPLKPAQQQFSIDWKMQEGIRGFYQSPDTGLGVNSANTQIQVKMPANRWILFVGGPTLGPAVLYWGVLVVIVLASLALSRMKEYTPLGFVQWLLLGIGLSPIAMESVLLVVVWLFALGWRSRIKAGMSKWAFNSLQLGLGVLTIIAISVLFNAVSQGLLGSPDMQIVGNGSSSANLNWFQDISPPILPQAWVVSVPMYIYRILMLLWALWLAFSLLKWLGWGWRCFSTHGYWQSKKIITTDQSANGQNEESEK